MATTRGIKGQTSRVLFALSFTDSTGAAADPTGTPNLEVHHVDAAGTITLKATLPLAKLASKVGWWGAFQDISDSTYWPAGDYQLVCQPTIAAVSTIVTDTFEIDDSAGPVSGAFVSGAYCSEAQVRGVSSVLASTTTIPQPLVLTKAVEAAREIDGRLLKKYVVPFTAPYPDVIVLLDMWLSAALCIEYAHGQQQNALGEELRSWVDGWIADILAGVVVLPVAPRPDSADGTTTSEAVTVPRVFSRDRASCSDMARY